MKKYSIRYTETYQRWYDVEANSQEEAIREIGMGIEITQKIYLTENGKIITSWEK